MDQDITKQLESDLSKAVDYFDKDIRGLRTGKASVALVEDISVETYGNVMPIKGVATITIPDAKSIVISPWDKNIVAAIEKAIRTSELNLSPVNMGDHVRINIPPLTEERRRDLIKVVKDKGEDAKIALRNARHGAMDRVKKAKNESKISEDDVRRLDNEINKLISKYNEKIDAIVVSKQQEMMEI